MAETVLAAVANPVVVLDRDLKVLDANPAMTQLSGVAHDEIVGQGWSEVVQAASADKAQGEKGRRNRGPQCAGNAQGPLVHDQAIVDREGNVRRIVWTDTQGPNNSVIRVGTEIGDGDLAEADASGLTPVDERSLAEAKRRAEEAEKLRQASAVVLESLELQEAIRRILEQLAYVLPYDSASVQLLRGSELEIVGGRGWENPAEVIGMRFPIPGDNPNTEIVQKRTPVVLSNAPQAYGEFREPPHDHIGSFLGVPLVVRDRLIGVLAADSQQPAHFTDDHVRVASAFADQVAIAIENARLYSELQKLSMTEPLTGLHNRRGLHELSRRELDRARRFDHPLSVLMVDLDRFKAINDTHGHAVGDDVLAAIARRCRRTVREVDVLSRYGGEEFVVLLPETELNEAQRIAERLRHEVERRPFPTEAGALSVTISVGVAVWQPSITDLDQLLERADEALYEAKRAGRNRVCHASSAS